MKLRKTKKFKFLILILVLTGLLSACKAEEEVEEDVDKPVTIMEAKTEEYSKDLEMSGNVKPAQSIKQGFKVAGVVENIYVKEGDNISEGQTLMNLGSHEYELGVMAAQSQYESLDMELKSKIDSAVNQAKANLDYVNTQLERVKRLHEKGAVSTKTVEELEVSLVVIENKYQEALDARNTAVSQLKQAGAALDLAQSQLNDTVLKSPINGTIIKQISEVGETMAPGYPAFLIGRLDKLEVEIGVPDKIVDGISIGQKVKTFIYGLDKEIEGVISNIDSVADLETRTFGVKIDIDNGERHIKPGMIANVIIDMGKESSIMVPIDSVIEDENTSYIYVYNEEEKTVTKKEVKVGDIREDKIQVLEGLEDGETIVVKGQYGLLDGEKVNARRVVEND